MSFDTYPLPENSPKLDKIQANINAQLNQLAPMVAKIYQGIDDRINGQQAALNKVENKIKRAVNGRIKQQGAALSDVGSSVVATLDQRIADQGAALALQSALLPRLAPQGGVPATLPQVAPVAPVLRLPSLGGQGAAQQQGNTIPLPPAVSAPPFSLSPTEVLPPSAIQATQPPTDSGTGEWIIIVDCDQKIAMAMVRNDPGWIPKIQAGHYIPIRYMVPHVVTISTDWVNRYAPNAVERACHAFYNKGEGWPQGGDFQETGQLEAIIGIPVGDWPFDDSGNYTGS